MSEGDETSGNEGRVVDDMKWPEGAVLCVMMTSTNRHPLTPDVNTTSTQS